MVKLYKEKSIHDIDQLYSWSLIIGMSVDLNERFTSPFRTDDKTPDCLLYERNGIIKFKPYSIKDKMFKGYNCIDAYMYLRGLSYHDALKELYKKTPIANKRQYKPRANQPKPNLVPLVVPYTPQGLLYWRKLGIDITQDKRVSQIEGYRLYDTVTFPKNEVAFSYQYEDRFKIYRPFAQKANKWKSSVVKSDTWFVDNGASRTLICKSAKCQIVLESLLKTKFNYTHPQSESDIINIPNAIAICDNDEAGIDTFHEYRKLGISSYMIPKNKAKDISDFIEAYDRFETFKLLLTMEREKYLIVHPQSEFQLVEDWNNFFGVDWNLERIEDVLTMGAGFWIIKAKDDVVRIINESKERIDGVYWFYVPEDRNHIAVEVDVFIHSVTIRNLSDMYHVLRSFNGIDLKKML